MIVFSALADCCTWSWTKRFPGNTHVHVSRPLPTSWILKVSCSVTRFCFHRRRLQLANVFCQVDFFYPMLPHVFQMFRFYCMNAPGIRLLMFFFLPRSFFRMGHSWSPPIFVVVPPTVFYTGESQVCTNKSKLGPTRGEARRLRGRIGHVEQNAWKAGFPVVGGAQVLEKEAVGEGNLCCMG